MLWTLVKAVVAAFNQEKALVGAFSVITNIRMELFEALMSTGQPGCSPPPSPATRQHVATLVTGDHTGLASRYILFSSL